MSARARGIALLLLAAGVALASCVSDSILGVASSTAFNTGTALHTISSGSLDRQYVLHVPAHRPTTQSGTLLAYPLVIVLHGSSGTGDDIRGTTNMDSVSEANRWVVAYPNGVSGSGGLFPPDWNAGTCCGAAARENIDDVGFIQSVITELSAKLPIDARRVYVAGFSDGGRMAYRLACELAPQITAIAVVSGSLKKEDCAPSRAVPVIAVHGTADPTVPYDDDADTPPPTELDSVSATLPPSLQFWISHNGCSKPATTQPSSRVQRTAFTCSGAETLFFSIDGGDHTWPVLTDTTSSDPDQTFAATAVIAQFFRRQIIR